MIRLLATTGLPTARAGRHASAWAWAGGRCTEPGTRGTQPECSLAAPTFRGMPATALAHPVSGAHQGTFDELGRPLYDVTFVVVDLETTGGSPADSAITEVGA